MTEEGSGEERTGYRSGERSLPASGADARGENRARTEPGARAVIPCDICGAPMLDRHCKLVCLRCGYQRDCSDP